MRFINADPKKVTVKDGIMTIHTEIGYDISVPFNPMVAINEQLMNTQLGFSLNLNLGNMEYTILPQDPGVVKNQDDLNKFLKTASYIPDTWNYDDFLIGFIYGDPAMGDPNNYKWMFQYE